MIEDFYKDANKHCCECGILLDENSLGDYGSWGSDLCHHCNSESYEREC